MIGICKTIKAKRMQMNISQKEMSEKLKMQQAGYSLLEKGKTQLTVDRLQMIADILNVPITYFFDKNVQELIDALMERLEETNGLLNKNRHEINLPDYKQETIEFYQKKEVDYGKLISSLEFQANILKKLNGYQQKEIDTAKEILITILRNIKSKKTIKPNLINKIQLFMSED